MAKLLDRLPYSIEHATATVRGELVRVKPHQIMVWVSIAPDDISHWDSKIPQLPAILDTGNNYNLSISSDQLVRWAGIQPASLERRKAILESGRRIPIHAATVWLHPNQPSTSKVAVAKEPFRLTIKEGIAIYEEGGPRLPVLGLRALTNSQLHLTVDGRRQWVWLNTNDWRAKLWRLL